MLLLNGDQIEYTNVLEEIFENSTSRFTILTDINQNKIVVILLSNSSFS